MAAKRRAPARRPVRRNPKTVSIAVTPAQAKALGALVQKAKRAPAPTREMAECTTCGLESLRKVLPDYGGDTSQATDGCPRCGRHTVRT